MLQLYEGAQVLINSRLCIIRRIPTFDVVQAQDIETGKIITVARCDVRPPLQEKNPTFIPFQEVLTDEQKRVRDLRFGIIEKTLGKICSRNLMAICGQQAVEAGLLKKGDISTIYDWKGKYEKSGVKNSLAPPLQPTGGRGKHRLCEDVDELLLATIDGSFLTSQKKRPTAVYNDTRVAFAKENRKRAKEGLLPLPTPCKKTLIKRIKALDPKHAEQKRYGTKSAKERMGIMKGHLVGGKWPWELGQMDHKQLRTVIIDDVTGEPLENPWLTVIIDTNSRVPPGFILSLKKPSATNIGLCLAMSMLPKDYWLNNWGMNQEDFPVFGKWGTIQADNELKNEASGIIAGCEANNITLEFRPLDNPQAGGFIESFFKTLDLELRNFPGFKSKNRKDGENYDANAKASFTMKRLNEAIAIIIIKIYCLKKHSSLNDAPLNVYKRNLIESGIGIPDLLIGDEIEKLILDFMPYEERTIQDYGVRMFNTFYRCDELEEYRKRGKEVK